MREVFQEEIGIYSSSCALNHNEILTFGGRSSPLKPSNKLFNLRFSPIQIEVNQVRVQGQCRPCARWKHAMVKLSESVILCGGRNTKDVLKDVFKLDTEMFQWSLIGCLPFGLFSHSMAVTAKSDILVSGGLLPDQKTLNDQLIQLNLNGPRLQVTRWRHDSLSGRFAHTSHVVGSKLILVGGIARAGEAGITWIDLESKLVRNFELAVPRNRFLTFYNHGSIFQPNNGIISVFGGGGNCFSFGMHVADSLIEIHLNQLC
ncbi:tRNA wybutosine-synthesizing protein 4-like [Tigriopus californicus]|uniref:tRNA wybutosine-synthesizing protein 4-like n=1 Tax=Tigriopus californicus TaxID=6832 RepID=UPI0027DA07E3|nr:tRNA wybutosine-synthesizing protein 4-like [Tigriopus californicus]